MGIEKFEGKNVIIAILIKDMRSFRKSYSNIIKLIKWNFNKGV